MSSKCHHINIKCGSNNTARSILKLAVQTTPHPTRQAARQ